MSKASCLAILNKHLPDCVNVNFSQFTFESNYLSSLISKSSILGEKKNIKHDILAERILRRLIHLHYYPAFIDNNKFTLKRFSLVETNEKYEYLYHRSDVPPNIILSQGIKPRYSLSYAKGFNPLIFLSNNGRWIGEYLYKVRLRQKLYYDTNLNWKCLNGHNAFCVTQKINTKDISLVSS